MNTTIFFLKLKNILKGKNTTLQGNLYGCLSVFDRFFTVWCLFEEFSYKHPVALNSFLVNNFLEELYRYLLDNKAEFDQITKSSYLKQDRFVRFLDRLANYDGSKYQEILNVFHLDFSEKS